MSENWSETHRFDGRTFVRALGCSLHLLRRRPVFVLACLLAEWLLSIALDVLLGPLSEVRYVNHLSALDYGVSRLIYGSIKVVVLCWPAALIGAQALLDLNGRKPERRPGLLDGARWAMLGLAYTILIGVPVALLMHVGFEALNQVIPMTSWLRSILSSAVGLALNAIVLLRFSLAWPHALATGNVGLFRSLRLTNDRYRDVLAALLPIQILAAIIHSLALHGFYTIADDAIAAAFQIQDFKQVHLINVAFIDLLNVLEAYIFNVAAVFVYQQLRGTNTVAQVFA